MNIESAIKKACKELKKNKYKLIDCQVPTQHLASMGAESIPRAEFLTYLS